MPLPVTEDTPPDMLAGAMDIKVLLPNGRTVNMSVERSTPMMDLLVQLTTAHKLSLAAHMVVALNENGAQLHHLPSTPIGALDTRLLHVMLRNNSSLKRPANRANNLQPFQTTFRLQVHLPRNQLFVSRVGPDMCLESVLHLACAEKNLDPAKYELRHPANLQEKLLLSHTLGDYRLQEVTMVASRAPGAPMTPADIMALQKEEEKRRQQVKATGSAYGIAFNKRSRANVHQSTGSVSSDSLNGRSISPAPSDESASRSISPPAPLPPTRPARKRRPAPKPPASSGTIQPPTNSRTQDVVQEDSLTYHSRTSSDSSGYHEASVLSETTDHRINGGSPADTLPRRSKLPSSNHMPAKQHKSSTLQHGSTHHVNLSRSLSNLTSAAAISSMHSASTTSLASQGNVPRKKKAAPPPPVAPARRPVQIERKVATNNEINRAVEMEAMRTKTIVEEESPVPERRASPAKQHVSKTDLTAHIQVPDTPTDSLKRYSKLEKDSSEEEITLSKVEVVLPKVETPSPKVSVILFKEENIAAVPPKVEAVLPKVEAVLPRVEVVIPNKENVPQKSDNTSRNENDVRPKQDVVAIAPKAAGHADVPLPKPVPVDAANVNPVPTPQPSAAQEASESDESINCNMDSMLKESHLDQRNMSPELESSDWEYHLPAPPSAFRDLNSPTTTEFGTVMLADTQVFQETVDTLSMTVPSVDIDVVDKSTVQTQIGDISNNNSRRRSKEDLQKHPDKMASKVEVSKSSGESSPRVSTNKSETYSNNVHVTVVEKRSDTKKIVPEDVYTSWEPQQLGEESKVTNHGGKLLNGDVRLRPDGVTREVFKVNPIFDAQQFEDSSSARGKVVGKYVPDEREIIEKSKTLITRNSSNDLQSSNTLKNFTISAYEKPKIVDTLYREDCDQNSAPVFKKPSPPAPLVRTNSYTNNDISRPASVKRSTSYISLARPYTKPSAFQSINRTKSINSLVLEEDVSGKELRKSTSEVNMTRLALDEEAPLHSLLVLKSILPQLSLSQTVLHEDTKDYEPIAREEAPPTNQQIALEITVTNQQPVGENRTNSKEMTEPQKEMSNNAPVEAPTTKKIPSKELNASNPDPKPFIYLGPPAINFGSWSERPKVQVSLKSDKDYRIGKQTSDTNTKPATQESTIPTNSFRNIAIEKVPTPNNIVDAKPTKIEPTPLTMRIVSHNHGGPRRHDFGNNHNNSSHSEYSDQDKERMQQAVHAFKNESVSRVPIVRAVELKKTVPEHFVHLRNMSSTHLNGGANNLNVSKISVNNYQGSNNVNRHSYINGDTGTQDFSHLGLTKSISTSQLNIDALNQTNRFSNNVGKKYTSVVGINGGSFESTPTQMPTKPAVHVRPNSSSIKVSGYNNAKPMPTVKGFRTAGDESAKIVAREEQTVKQDTTNSFESNISNAFKSQPLKTINGIDQMRTTPSWAQRNSSINQDKFVNKAPEVTKQSTTIKFKKPIQRPVEQKFTNPRDALMDAIKNFGGQDALKLKNGVSD